MPPKKRPPTKAASKSTSKKSKKDTDPSEEEIDVVEVGDVPALNVDTSGHEDPDQPTTGVLISGLPISQLAGRARDSIQDKCLWLPHRLAGLNAVKIDHVVSHCSAAHSVLISSEGEVFTFGRNETGQLGVGQSGKGTDVDIPTKIKQSEFNNERIMSAACGKGHTLFLSTEGHVYACGDNSSGQLGINSIVPDIVNKPRKIPFSAAVKMKLVACGSLFSMVVDVKGDLYSFGHPEYGQLGHGSESKVLGPKKKYVYGFVTTPLLVTQYVVKGAHAKDTKPVDNVCVEKIACGFNHTIVVDQSNRIFTWGCGAYGRLGHNAAVDEYIPRQNIGFLHFSSVDISGVGAGSTYTLITMSHKMTYFCGQTRMSANAAEIYFKPVMDISGWNVSSIGTSNKSIVLSSEGQTIAWGPSPTFGEMALCAGSDPSEPPPKFPIKSKDTKTSSIPKLVESLADVYVMKLACGCAHSLFLIDLSSRNPPEGSDSSEVMTFEENVKKFNQFPIYLGYKGENKNLEGDN